MDSFEEYLISRIDKAKYQGSLPYQPQDHYTFWLGIENAHEEDLKAYREFKVKGGLPK